MGTFGVLRPDDKTCTITVKDCHINVWSLDGLLGRRVLLLDIGLRLLASTADQQSLTVIVPGETAPEPPVDLVPLLRDEATLRLIFAQTVPIANDVITLAGEDLELLPINCRETKSEVSDASFSQWHIHFARPVSVQRDSYVRFRFRLQRTERLWEWRRSGLVRVRSVIDFRIGDIRGVAVPDAETLACRALAIGGLNLFVIAPLWLRMQSASPALKYMRLFEGRMWERYLDRATKLGRRREKLVIYQWEAGSVTTLSPYRAFLDLGREPDVTSLRNHFAGALVFAAIIALAVAAWAHSDPITAWASKHAPLIWKTLVGAVSLSALIEAASWFAKVRKVWHRAANEFERFESWLFHIFRS